MGYLMLILGALVVAFISSTWRFMVSLAVKPYLKSKKLREQGVRGPKPSFLLGNVGEIKRMIIESRDMVLDIRSHDHLIRVLPHLAKWVPQYGGIFMYFLGQQPWLCVTDPDLVKQILFNKFDFYKPDVGPGIMAMMGKGLVLSEGEQWERHRDVITPAFAMDKLKMMTRTMAECVQSMLKQWQEKEEVDICLQFQELTADIISSTAFGSSYAAGKEVFLAQKELLMINFSTTLNNLELPINKYLPTEKNKHRWELEKKLRGTLVNIIEKRLALKETGYGQDLLGLMMEANMTGQDEETMLSMDEIIDECKTFFFAGHETTTHLLTWSMFLLSTHQEWQQKLREEVFTECGKEIPDSNKLNKLKLMTMVLYEVLRLYPPVVVTARTSQKDIKLGSLMIPKGADIMLPIAVIHHSKEVWGPDAKEFNPLRFENGVSKAAKHPNAMLAFSVGPRACIGQNFALMEAKTVLSMILQNYNFTLSPDYKHMPVDMITLQPQKGLHVVLKTLEE